MKFASFVALLGLLAFSPLSAQTTQAYQITLSTVNGEDSYILYSLTSNANYTGIASPGTDSQTQASTWVWTNSSLETPIFHAISGGPLSGNYTSLYQETFTISNQGFLTYSITAGGLAYSSKPVTAVAWGITLQPFTFPTTALSLPDFLSTVTRNQPTVGSINFLFGDQTFVSPPISNISIEVATVPEPSALALFGGAGALLLWVRHIHRRR